MVDIKAAYPLHNLERSYSSLYGNCQDEYADTRYQMVALDLDGTLLQSNRKISDSTVEYLRELDRRGLKLAFATGRSAKSTYEHIQRLNLPSPFPVVCSNGAKGIICYVDSTRDDTVFFNPLTMDVTHRTIEHAKRMNYVSMCYYDDKVHANSSCPEHITLTNLYKRLSKSEVSFVTDDFESLIKERGPPNRILVMFLRTKIEDIEASFEEELAGNATIIAGNKGWYLEILNASVTKGNGLRSMCYHLDIPLESCIAIGDGENDIEFLHMAGFGICMKNGKDVAKKAADAVSEWTNNEDGVMLALRQLERSGMLRLDTR
jgi:Cof subfamily protein (haloacid dehalogenase superfamily)